LEIEYEVKSSYIMNHFFSEGEMHNLLSRSQLEEWRHLESTIDDLEAENQKIADYYECIVECDINHQNECKKICRILLK
jgi:hypothetical protein